MPSSMGFKLGTDLVEDTVSEVIRFDTLTIRRFSLALYHMIQDRCYGLVFQTGNRFLYFHRIESFHPSVGLTQYLIFE